MLKPRVPVSASDSRYIRVAVSYTHLARRICGHVECIERRADHREPADQNRDIDNPRVADQFLRPLIKACLLYTSTPRRCSSRCTLLLTADGEMESERAAAV